MGIEGINPNSYSNFSIDTYSASRSSSANRIERSTSKTESAGSFSKVEGDVADISFEAAQSFLSLGSDSVGSSARAERVQSLKSLIDSGEYFNRVDSFSVAGDPGLIEAILG